MQDQIIGLEGTVEQELFRNRCKVTTCKIRLIALRRISPHHV